MKERIERVKEKSGKDGVLTKDSEFSDEVMGIRKDFVAIHGEMVLLKNYSSLNFAGTAAFTLYLKHIFVISVSYHCSSMCVSSVVLLLF